MTLLIIAFGALTLLAGIVIVINPEIIFGFLRNNLEKQALHVLAVVVRLVLGALLIVQSNVSRFPFAIEFMMTSQKVIHVPMDGQANQWVVL